MVGLTLVLCLTLFPALAYFAGAKSNAASTTEHGRLGAASGILRSLLGSVIILGVGAVPFLILELTLSEQGGGASFVFMVWIVVGPLICFFAIPLAHVLIPLPHKPGAAGWLVLPMLWAGVAVSVAGILILIPGGTLPDAVMGGLLVVLIGVCWMIYGKLMRPRRV